MANLAAKKGRINLKAVYITDDFSAEEFSQNLADEIVTEVNGLLEKQLDLRRLQSYSYSPKKCDTCTSIFYITN